MNSQRNFYIYSQVMEQLKDHNYFSIYEMLRNYKKPIPKNVRTPKRQLENSETQIYFKKQHK